MYEVRYDNQPKLNKIFKNLETIVEKTKSMKSCNLLGEFYQAQDKKEGHKELAAKYYGFSADQGCLVGIHWLGVFYRMGFGVQENKEKSLEYLTKASKMGNCLSSYQLASFYATEESIKDVKKAYYYLEKAVLNGMSQFDDLHHIFKENQEVLTPIFLANKKPSTLVDKDNKDQVLNLHESYVNELKTTFSSALSKDRLYQRAAGFIEENKVWIIGVLFRYFVK